MASWVYGGSTTVKLTASKKHYKHKKVSCSATTKHVLNSSGRIFYYFTPGGSTKDSGVSEMSSGTKISQTIPTTEGEVEVYLYASTYSNPACSSVSASMVYGSKATPTVYCSFKSGYVNPFQPKTYTFGVNYISDIDEQYTIKSGTFFHRVKGTETWTETAFTGSSVTFPAGTYTSGNEYEYYGTLILDDNTSATTETYTMTTVDGVPSCNPLAPNNAIIYGSTGFSWSYTNTRSTPQFAYDLQVSIDSGATWTLLADHIETTETSMPEQSGFSAGEWLWRVRCYNNDNVASEWSATAMFISNVVPDAPEITDLNAYILEKEVSWTSNSQAAFQVQFENLATGAIAYDSGEVYSSRRTYKFSKIIPAGNYLVRVRIINEYGKESPWGTAECSITVGSIDAFGIYSDVENGTKITVETGDPMLWSHIYIMRDGILIAEIPSEDIGETATYLDRFARSRSTYTVIAEETGGYPRVATFTVTAEPSSARITRQNGQSFEVDQRWNDMFKINGQESRKNIELEYLGASSPDHIFAKMRTKRYSFAFYDPDRIGSELLGEKVFYIDQYGNSDWCVITSVNRSDEWFGDDTALELERTTMDEEITAQLAEV